MNDEFAKLVEMAKLQDSKAAEEILTRLRPLICSQTRHDITGMDKDDLYQEACLLILECVKNFDAAKGVPFLAYVKRSMQYKMWNLKKAARYEISLDEPTQDETTLLDTLMSKASSVDEQVFLICKTDGLKAALASISKKQLQVLVMHYYEGIKLSDIAKIRDVHPKAVMHLKKRAINALCKKMNEKEMSGFLGQ